MKKKKNVMDTTLIQMQNIVEQNVLHYKTDFYDYDINTYQRMFDKDRFIWIVRNYGTNVCGIYKDIKDEVRRSAIKETAQLYFNHYAIQNYEWCRPKFFIVTKGVKIEQITVEQFRKLCE